MTEHAKKIGCDKLVDLYCFDEGLMIGMWKVRSFSPNRILFYGFLKNLFISMNINLYAAFCKKEIPGDLQP